MKKIIFTLALIVAAMNSFAQSNTYRDAARSLMEMSGNALSAENMKKTINGTLEAVTKSMPQMDGADTKVTELIEKLNKEVFEPYFGSDEFKNDMLDVMTPALENEFSEAEIKELVEVYSTPEAKDFIQKGGAMIGDLGGMMQDMMPAISAISMGGEAPEVEKVECSDEYRQVFTEYFNLCSSATLQNMESKLAGDGNPLNQKLLAYIKTAMPEMTLKMCKNTFTIDDMKSGIKLVSNPLAQRFIKASTNMGEQAIQPMMQKLGSKMTKIMMGM